MRSLIAIFLLFSSALPVSAEEYPFHNVVKIESVFQEERPHSGFGFAVHASKDSLYIVTAYHVIIDAAGRGAQQIIVSFYKKESHSVARLVAKNGYADLALLALPKPREYGWDLSYRAEVARANDNVWIIGYNGTWIKRSQQAEGRVVEVVRGDIEADFDGARQGCSGGPLMIDNRVAGMVTMDAGTRITALNIGIIFRFVYPWLKIRGKVHESGRYVPDDPAIDLPFVAAGGGIGGSSVLSSANGANNASLADFSYHYFAECMVIPELSIGIAGGSDRFTMSAQWDTLSREFKNRMPSYGVFVKYYSYFFADPLYFVTFSASRLRLNPQIKINNGAWMEPRDLQGNAVFDSKTSYLLELKSGLMAKGSVIEGGLELSVAYSTKPLALDIQNLNSAAKSTHWMFRAELFLGFVIRNAEPELKVLRY